MVPNASFKMSVILSSWLTTQHIMSEKGKEKEMCEEEEERETVDHWSHYDPLTLVDPRRRDVCYSCGQLFNSGEQAYGCSINGCDYSELLHQECAAMPRRIRHPLHPQHILVQRRQLGWASSCKLCTGRCWGIIYHCRSSRCDFYLHPRCAQGGGAAEEVADSDDDQSRAIIHHPSHPNHELKLWRRRCSFKCDACGTTRKGSSYTCTHEACQFWIHERCASLPTTIEREDHHHSLYLSFHVPVEYIKYDYKCDVCTKFLFPQYWIYHCQLCRYIVHVKCAFNKSTIRYDADAKDIIHLPTKEVAEELITPFVMRQGGERTLVPPTIISHDDDELVNVKYKFLHHEHELSLVSSSPHDEEEEEEDEENYGKRWELICDGCITPISSSSSSSSTYYYMSCSECKYNLHIACFHLPPHLSSLPIHKYGDDHPLLLQSSSKTKAHYHRSCSLCYYSMNGLFYKCKKCSFSADIKCACMPATIHHAAHPHHLLEYVTWSDLRKDIYSLRLLCAAASGCDDNANHYHFYRCSSSSSSSCDFIVHLRCAMLPASVTSSRWDKHHKLLLTYDANLNHPGDFYCDQCETQMNPKSWMYHCRHCDVSFHPTCFAAASGRYRNTMFGQKYENARAHPHTLTYQLLTTKLRCDICGYNKHEKEGFHCASCNFFVCLDYCGEEMIKKGYMKAVD